MGNVMGQEKTNPEPNNFDTMFKGKQWFVTCFMGSLLLKYILTWVFDIIYTLCLSTFTDCDSLVVLTDYPCRDISEPIFRIGDKLKGLSE